MNSQRCCRGAGGRGERSAPVRGRLRRVVEWVVPGVLLLAMPKCPACLAAYVAAFTGLGLSLSAAAHLRMAVIALCVVMLVAVVTRCVYARAARRVTS